MKANSIGLKNFGYSIPRPPVETKLHINTKGGIRGYREGSLSYDDLQSECNAYRDALYYIDKECYKSIQDCKKIGHKIHGDSTAWEILCEVQASLERIKDNCTNELILQKR